MANVASQEASQIGRIHHNLGRLSILELLGIRRILHRVSIYIQHSRALRVQVSRGIEMGCGGVPTISKRWPASTQEESLTEI